MDKGLQILNELVDLIDERKNINDDEPSVLEELDYIRDWLIERLQD